MRNDNFLGFFLESHLIVSWYNGVDIIAKNGVSEAALQKALDVLFQAKVLPSSRYDLTKVIDERIASLERDIKFIKLYNKPELVKYIRNNLRHAGLEKGSITYDQITPYDQVKKKEKFLSPLTRLSASL